MKKTFSLFTAFVLFASTIFLCGCGKKNTTDTAGEKTLTATVPPALSSTKDISLTDNFSMYYHAKTNGNLTDYLYIIQKFDDQVFISKEKDGVTNYKYFRMLEIGDWVGWTASGDVDDVNDWQLIGGTVETSTYSSNNMQELLDGFIATDTCATKMIDEFSTDMIPYHYEYVRGIACAKYGKVVNNKATAYWLDEESWLTLRYIGETGASGLISYVKDCSSWVFEAQELSLVFPIVSD